MNEDRKNGLCKKPDWYVSDLQSFNVGEVLCINWPSTAPEGLRHVGCDARVTFVYKITPMGYNQRIIIPKAELPEVEQYTDTAL